MGDESSVASPSGAASIPAQANEDLLQQIFGGSSNSAPAKTIPAGNGKASVNDILGLFDSSPAVSTAVAPTAAASSPFDGLGSGSTASLFSTASTPQPARAAPAQKSAGYVAYNKNSLKITLHPQVSAQRPGVVLVTARFEVAGSTPAQSVNFQAAVPKVRFD